MSYVNIPSYEGNSPFIYVYYAEEDTRLALPVLARLYNEGLRMWSWNGCASPTDVRASQRISSCAALLIFLSENLDRDIQRGYFEAMEALRCNKVKYFVRLSDVELPFDWGKSDANVVIDYVRSNEAAFWLSIYDSEIIEGCRGAWPTKKVTAGLSAFDSIDSSELSDEYSNILKIIGDSPALDRSGVPINAEDIALFAGAGEPEENRSEPTEPAEPQVDDLNRKSMEDLFGMLDEISVSTRRKADELREAAEKRRADMEKAAMSQATLPFQQDVAAVEYTDEPPVPALSFIPSALAVEDIAAEMFNLHISELTPIEAEPQEEAAPTQETESLPEDIIPESDEPTAPTFEEFIDELTADANEDIAPAAEAETAPEIIEEPVHMATHPITVEITEESASSLLPPAGESLTDFTLPDDNYMTTVFLVNDDENDTLPSAAERAAAAEESRKQFESALEKAAYSVTGRIVARHSKGDYSVGLRVRKPKTVKLAVQAKGKAEKEPVRVSPTPIAKEAPKAEETDRSLSRAERRARRRKSSAEPIEETPLDTQEVRRLSVTPEPMRGEMPTSAVTHTVAAPVAAAPLEVDSGESAENTPTPRKKRHPHNSSGLLGMLRTLRSQSNIQESEEDVE